MFTPKTRSYGFLVLLLMGIFGFSLSADAAGPSYSVSVGGGSFSPNPITGSMTATASLTGTLNVQNPNQEIQEGGDTWTWSASVTGYKATSQAAFGSVPNGIATPVVSASSGSATSTVTATSSEATTPVTYPGYYLITVSATDRFTLTDSSTSPPTVTPQSQPGSTTLQIVVVIVGDIQYNDPQNGWTSVPEPLYDLKGNSITLRAIPIPADASFPSGYPTWGGSSGASGTGATTTVSPSTLSASTSDYKAVTASCGNVDSSNLIVFDLIPLAIPTDKSVPNHNPTHIGVGEVINLSYNTTPSGLSQSQIGAVAWTMTGNITTGSGTMLSTNPYQYQAGPIGGGTTFTLTITTGPSAGGLRTLTEVIFAPTLARQVNAVGTTNPFNPTIPFFSVYHDNTNNNNGPSGATASVGFCGWYCLSPNDVSFANVTVREVDCTPSKATGSLAGLANTWHLGAYNPNTLQSIQTVNPGWISLVFDTTPSINSWKQSIYDQAGFGPFTQFGSGAVQYQIPYCFQVVNGDANNSTLIQSVLQSSNEDTSGGMTLSKAGVSVATKSTDPYVGPFPPYYNSPNYRALW